MNDSNQNAAVIIDTSNLIHVHEVKLIPLSIVKYKNGPSSSRYGKTSPQNQQENGTTFARSQNDVLHPDNSLRGLTRQCQNETTYLQ
jgi:hypothetical protein